MLEVLAPAALDIWFVLLLDIWYPKLNEKVRIKKIGAKARDDSGYLHEKAKKTLDKNIEKLAKERKVSADDIQYLFPDELGRINKKVIEKRKKFCLTTDIEGLYSIYDGKKAKELLAKYLPKPKKIKSGEALKGMVASRGKARGIVRKVILHKEFKNFKKGEILVALQTMVNYVPVMKRAKAILTEYGGLTSHAAIVSRELKKPCIVGIKGLTSSLEDGDKIEVDANKGIVRKVK